jgi:hypothetical protein
MTLSCVGGWGGVVVVAVAARIQKNEILLYIM